MPYPPRLPAFAFMLCCLLLAPAALANAPATGGADLHGLVHAYVERQVQQQGLVGETHIQIDASKLGQQPACAQAEAFVAGQGTLRSRFSVGVRCQAPTQWVAYVPVQLRVLGQYPVAARPLPPHTVLSETDVTLHEGDLLRLPAGVALSLDDVLGHTTQQRIAAKQTLKHNTLQAPHSVQRGQPVTLEVRGDGFSVSGEGIAMQSGEPGAIIQARTPNGQIVQGRVLNGRTLLLTM